MEKASNSTVPETNCPAEVLKERHLLPEDVSVGHRTTIACPMSLEEFYEGIASLSPETRKRFVADLIASDPAWAPYLDGVDLEAPGSGKVYRCGTCGFETKPHESLADCVKEFEAWRSDSGSRMKSRSALLRSPQPAREQLSRAIKAEPSQTVGQDLDSGMMEYGLACGRKVRVEELYIGISTLGFLAGRREAIRAG